MTRRCYVLVGFDVGEHGPTHDEVYVAVAEIQTTLGAAFSEQRPVVYATYHPNHQTILRELERSIERDTNLGPASPKEHP